MPFREKFSTIAILIGLDLDSQIPGLLQSAVQRIVRSLYKFLGFRP